MKLAKQPVHFFSVNMFSLFVTVKLEAYIYHHKRHVKKLALLHVRHCGHYWNNRSNHSSYQIVLNYLWLLTHQVYTCTQLYEINGFLYTHVDISSSGNSDIYKYYVCFFQSPTFSISLFSYYDDHFRN